MKDIIQFLVVGVFLFFIIIVVASYTGIIPDKKIEKPVVITEEIDFLYEETELRIFNKSSIEIFGHPINPYLEAQKAIKNTDSEKGTFGVSFRLTKRNGEINERVEKSDLMSGEEKVFSVTATVGTKIEASKIVPRKIVTRTLDETTIVTISAMDQIIDGFLEFLRIKGFVDKIRNKNNFR